MVLGIECLVNYFKEGSNVILGWASFYSALRAGESVVSSFSIGKLLSIVVLLELQIGNQSELKPSHRLEFLVV